MGKRILNVGCAILSILYALMGILLAIDVFTEKQMIYTWYMSDKVTDVRIFFGLPVIYFLVYNIVIWNRQDKKPFRLILLLVLNVYYMPFYYFKSIKRGWDKN